LILWLIKERAETLMQQIVLFGLSEFFFAVGCWSLVVGCAIGDYAVMGTAHSQSIKRTRANEVAPQLQCQRQL
jgi:hypothetical protein